MTNPFTISLVTTISDSIELFLFPGAFIIRSTNKEAVTGTEFQMILKSEKKSS